MEAPGFGHRADESSAIPAVGLPVDRGGLATAHGLNVRSLAAGE